ncbi:hypothetical protein [Dactylosporangium sp. NPDC000521]|uniref:hypothetical protein n=1 Tax=Dactylosporangium sp. NPDC000521 TaxID=3363975 RepID=UPI0036C2EC81
MLRTRRQRPRSRLFTGRWRVLLAAMLALVAIAGGSVGEAGVAYAADTSVPVDNYVLRDRLFSAHMRNRAQGVQGLEHMFLSAEMVGYRQTHPGATAKDLMDHAVVMSNWYDSKLRVEDLERPAYEFVMKLIELSATHPAGAVASPIMKELIESTLGEQLRGYGDMVDRVAASQFMYSFFDQVYAIQDRVWGSVARLGETDSTFAAAWDGQFGVRYNVSSTASSDQLQADPVIATYVNVQGLLDHADVMQEYLLKGNSELKQLLDQINARLADSAAAANSLNVQFPINGANPTQAALDQAKAQAAQRQQWIDGAAGAVQLLSTLIGFANPRAGEIAAGTGKAAIQIATAVNAWLPTIASKGLVAALTSMSTLAMAGNVLGAIQALVPLFGGGPSPEEQIKEELRQLRQEVVNMSNQMNTRFDRIESALTEIYSQMLQQFDILLKLHDATAQQLADITRQLADLTYKVDFWGQVLVEGQRADRHSPLSYWTNGAVGFKAMNNGRELPWNDPAPASYLNAATTFVTEANDTSRREPLARTTMVNTGNPDADVNAVLDSYHASGAIQYLNDYARRYLGMPDGDAVGATPDVEFWLAAAEPYKMLMTQNPDHSRVQPTRSDLLVGAGYSILNGAATFSKPRTPTSDNPARLNPIIENLIRKYRAGSDGIIIELEKLRDLPRAGHPAYNQFGPANQAVPDKPAAEPTVVANCTREAAFKPSRPANVQLLAVPQELWVAAYARPNTSVRLCYDANWENMIEPDEPGGDKPYAIYADLKVTMRIQQGWDGKFVTVRQWEKVFPYGKMGQYYPPRSGKASWLTAPDQGLSEKWGPTYKAQFEASAPMTVSDDAAAVTRVRDWHNSVAGNYYAEAERRMTTAGDPLNTLVRQMTTSARLLDAYVRLGFARSLQQDEQLALHLVGVDRLPYEYGWSQVVGPFSKARDTYCSAVANNQCVVRPNGVFDPRTGQNDGRVKLLPCAWTTNPDRPVVNPDPVVDCVWWLSALRSNRVRDSLEGASVRLATQPGYTEGIPAVEMMIQSIVTAKAVAQHAVPSS